jgi:hypothetical protein
MGLEIYINKEKIETGREIKIPDNAKYFRLKKGEMLFFAEKNESRNNGFTEIPKDTKKIIFSEYRKHMYHIEYGNPKFL